MEPVRIRVYGLFPLTKRRYLGQAVAGVVATVLVFVGWWFAWPPMRDRLTRPELPPSAFRDGIVAVMNDVPWILLAALVYKAVEVVVVLRPLNVVPAASASERLNEGARSRLVRRLSLSS